MSSQSPSTPSSPADQDGRGVSPAAAFGANEWLVDEIYQQYLQDPNSVDRAWWDFFADYKPGAAETPSAPAATTTAAPSAPHQDEPGETPRHFLLTVTNRSKTPCVLNEAPIV
ncbi:hypothetical protein AB0M64_36355, partial [Streptomyces sp. NPDC051771]|uniref:2-oxoglutarate dehydrogenase E1 subunit family protein n=1 Tax=Streptomyces sp. NPDC051771 TaxID=3154847 RepID=UPI00343470A2